MSKVFENVFGDSLRAQANQRDKVSAMIGKGLRGDTKIRHGKTAKDKANGHVAYRKNRRVWDDDSRTWVKV